MVCPYAWDQFGGVQSHIAALSRALAERGHEVMVVAPHSHKKRSNGTGKVEVKLVGRAVGVPANGSVAPLAFGPGAAIGVRRVLSAFGPDVLHLHEPLIPSLSLLALANSKSPSVGTFHAATDASLGYWAAKPVLSRAVRRLAVRTAVSDSARRLASRYFPGEYVLTPNGIDVSKFATAEPVEVAAGNTVLFLGRIERRKGLGVLIQAMTRLPDLRVTLVVAGTGPQERSCRKLADQLGVSTRWIGGVDENDLARVYKSARVYCAPGLGGESFGIVLIEAMAAGTPLVCSDLHGFRAVAAGAAELVPPGDAGRLADALRRVLTDEQLASEMSKSGARLARMYDWRRLVAGVEAVYERAVSK
jgi:phosphatidylinositol alpha-mannosyltransferase